MSCFLLQDFFILAHVGNSTMAHVVDNLFHYESVGRGKVARSEFKLDFAFLTWSESEVAVVVL